MPHRTDTPDTLGFRITHRAMRGDTRRLAAVTTEIAAARQSCDRVRATAISTFITKLCDGIHHHHAMEDKVLWPVLERSAGAAVDLSDLSDDHSQLDPLLDELRASAAAFLIDRTPAGRLATLLGTLADLLDEHIEEEERTIFPIIEKYVSVSDWLTVETAVRKGGDAAFDLPRIAQYARPEELAQLKKIAGPVLSVMLALTRRPHRRRQRLIFGPLATV